MMKNVLILLLASALAALLWRDHQQARRPLPEKPAILRLLDEAESDPGLAGAAIGFCLLDENGQTVHERHARTAFIPASSLKTVTTATALEKWGPDFQIETRVMAAQAAVNGIIEGDVTILGGGDPMLSLQDLTRWAGELHAKGLRRIQGCILGDGRLFAGSHYDDFWNWGDIGNGYGSAVSGLNLEHNRYAAFLRAGAAIGSAAELLGTQTEVPGITWQNEVVTGAADSGDGVVIHGGERTGVVHLRGSVPLGQQAFQVLGAVPDPELYAAHHFREALLKAGIEVTGPAAAIGKGSAGTIELLKHRSPPLREIITSIHATSDNHETECLFRLLGTQAGQPPDQVVREHWKARGLEFQGLRMEDGCGLARADFITPQDLARLQHLAASGAQGPVYVESLLAKDNLRWKGGAMSGVRSTTGLITNTAGRRFSFALMVNHYADGAAVARLREALIQAMGQ